MKLREIPLEGETTHILLQKGSSDCLGGHIKWQDKARNE